MVRPSQRLFPFLRSGLRTNLVAPAPPRATISRCMMSSHAGHSSGGNEMYWKVGGTNHTQLLYLLSPAARKTAHKHTVEHEKHPEAVAAATSHAEEPPITDDEGTVISGDEVKESIEHAIAEDSPSNAQAREEEVAAASPTETLTEPLSTQENGNANALEELHPGTEPKVVPMPETDDSVKDGQAVAGGEPEKPAADQTSAVEA
ncbi:hypothetical protein ID866_7822 [Astraeus odoratus]|nr:hypothetical protein ID866_7822 [Astraeus odoratus]